MSVENEKDLTRTKRFTRLAIVCAFLLAFFWPLGSFFFWIFFGATSYFIFLAIYYRPRPKQDENFSGHSRPAWKTQKSEPGLQDTRKKIFLIVFIIGGTVFFILFMLMIIGFIVGDDPPDQAVVDTTDENVDRLALASNPSDLNALTNLGNYFYAQNQFDSALFYYDKILSIDPQNSSGMYNKALVFYQTKNYAKSIEWTKKCFSMHPENIDATILTGDNYYAQENFSEAIGWYRQAYDKGARNPELLNIMAYIYDRQNRSSEAIQFYKETLEQDSSYQVYGRLAELDPARGDWYRKKAEQWKLR